MGNRLCSFFSSSSSSLTLTSSAAAAAAAAEETRFRPPLRQQPLVCNAMTNSMCVTLLLPANGGSVPCFYVHHRRAPITLLVSHGSEESINGIHEGCRRLSRRLNVNVMAYEYPGYAPGTLGPATEDKCCASIVAALDFLTGQMRLAPGNVVLLGKDVGCVPAAHLAALNANLRAVVLVAPPAGLADAGRIQCPALVVQGTSDPLFKHAADLLADLPDDAGPHAHWWVQGAHARHIAQHPLYFSKIDAFLA